MSKIPVVRDFMITKVVTLSPEMDIHDAMRKLIKHSVSGAPVVNKKSELQGTLSEKDCMRVFAAAAYSDLPRGTVAEYMVIQPETVSPDQDLFSLASIFMHRHYRRLPVVEQGRLLGLATRPSVLRACLNYWENPNGKAWTDSKYLSDDLKAALE